MARKSAFVTAIVISIILVVLLLRHCGERKSVQYSADDRRVEDARDFSSYPKCSISSSVRTRTFRAGCDPGGRTTNMPAVGGG